MARLTTPVGSRRRHSFTLLAGGRREPAHPFGYVPPVGPAPAPPNPYAHIPTRDELTGRQVQGQFVPQIPAAALTAAGLPASLATAAPQPRSTQLTNPTAPNALLDLIGPAKDQELSPLEQLLTGVGKAAADPLATVLHVGGYNAAPKPPAAPVAAHVDTFHPTGPTPEIRAAEAQSHKDFLREQGGVPAPVDRGGPAPAQQHDISDAPFTAAQLHPAGADYAKGQIANPKTDGPPGSRFWENGPSPAYQINHFREKAGVPLIPEEVPPPTRKLLREDAASSKFGFGPGKINPYKTQQDPLGKKTLGNVTEQQLLAASQAGTLKIGKHGILSTPENRQALHQLLLARHQVAQSDGLTGPFNPKQEQFILGVAKGTGLTPRAIGAQALAEEGGGPGSPAEGYEQEGNFNFLNVGPGKHYGSLAEGIQQTIDTFHNGNYADVLATAGQGAPAQIEAIGNSPWGTVLSTLKSTIGQVGYQHDPKSLQALHVATAAAAALGIKIPAPGQKQGEVTYVHQTAKTALQWAEHALGVTTGSTREVHFAELVGGVTDPWCAVFVSTALKKVGIEPPANPSYSGAFAENWKGGKNLNTTDLAKAKPGDLLIFDWGTGGMTDHVAIYKGGNQMIGGNQGQGEVSLEEVPAGNIVSIVRPHYTGKQVAVADGGAATGTSTSGTSSSGSSSEGATGTSGEAIANNAAVLAATPSPLQLPGFAATPLFANTEPGAPGEDQAEMLRLLTQPGLGRGHG